jgi:L-serine/L-threonine ammonia-lyase
MASATPLVASAALAQALGVRRAWLKLESSHASGSFKERGMRVLCAAHRASGARRVVSSSGGNAGLAAALVARELGLECLVVVPSTTKALMVDKIKLQGATVRVHGDNWNGADALARELCQTGSGSAYVPPFDHPLLWQGHSQLVDELATQMAAQGGARAPDLVVASVGGGGLLSGVLHGLARQGGEWASHTRVVAAETRGSASMAAALAAGHPVRLAEIKTIATSLGALAVSEDVVRLARAHAGGVVSGVVEDADCVRACVWLADHARVLVEPACGAALAAMHQAVAAMPAEERASAEVVLVVCGGSAISLDMLAEYRKQFAC